MCLLRFLRALPQVLPTLLRSLGTPRSTALARLRRLSESSRPDTGLAPLVQRRSLKKRGANGSLSRRCVDAQKGMHVSFTGVSTPGNARQCRGGAATCSAQQAEVRHWAGVGPLRFNTRSRDGGNSSESMEGESRQLILERANFRRVALAGARCPFRQAAIMPGWLFQSFFFRLVPCPARRKFKPSVPRDDSKF